MIFIAAFVALYLFFWIVIGTLGPLTEGALARAAHWTASFRYRDYVPVVVVLVTGIAAAAVAGDVFGDIAERVQSQSSKLHEVDGSVYAWAHETRTSGATAFFTLMTVIGTPVGLGVIAFAVAVWLAARQRWRFIAYLAVTAATGGFLNLWLKSTFARARPELAAALRDAHGYSFPSGHAMGSTLLFGALSYLAFRMLRTWPARATVLAFNASMIVAIAASRIYLGVHWISDIAGGIAAGTVWLATTTVAYEAFRRIRLIRALRAKRRQFDDDDSASPSRTSRGK